MHFVNDVNLKATCRWRILRVIQQLAHIVNLRIGGGIDLNNIDKTAFVDFNTSWTSAAWMGADTRLTIQGFCQNTCDGSFAYTACSGKEIGVMQALLLQRMRKRAHDMILSDQAVEILGTILAGENLIGHAGR